MHRFSRMHLSAADAMQKLDAIDLEEKSRIAEGVALIAVIDHRKDYLAAGYSSMFSYCMGRLHMSEDKAVRRIESHGWRSRLRKSSSSSPTVASA